ncbi:MAG TPA: LysM domain-containing protein [Lacipirellulaceae bacterium]|jgi:nucleoid-associated protein YgaU|nr:LysM domain-containing protein [Lacipirellulaceae bacterium]
MKTSKTNLIAIFVTVVAPFVASVAVAAHTKDPKAGQGSPIYQRPTNGSSTTASNNVKGKTIADAKLYGTQTATGGITITHGGNPPRGDGSGFTITHGGNPPRNCGNSQTSCNNNCYHDSCHRDYCHGSYCCVQMYGNEGFEPLHSAYVVVPGDTLYTVSMKEYGTSGNSRYIAVFNRLPSYTALVPGQTLMLPSISANKVLSPSHAPVATPLQVTLTN